MALKKICCYAGCKVLVDYTEKYCNKHKEAGEQLTKQRHKEYKTNRKDKKEQEFYNTRLWKQAKESAKYKTFGIDVYEWYINERIVMGETVHHIIEIKEDWSKRLDIEKNLIYLTNSNHQVIHKIYSKSEHDKKQMQKLLMELLKRFNEEFK